MEFYEYVEKLKEEVGMLCEEGTELKTEKIIGNNGTIHTAISIRKKEKRSSPLVHLDDYYEAYREGRMSVRSAAEEVCKTFRAFEIPPCANLEFGNFEAVRDKIIYQLIDYGRNRDMLKGMPYINYCDLAIVFCLMLGEAEEGCLTAMIHNEYMKAWNADIGTLYELARTNTPRLLPAEIKTMEEVMRGIAGGQLGCECGDAFFSLIPDQEVARPLYMMTNSKGLRGAATILYEGVLKMFADKIKRDLFILPSSIHEVLLIPYDRFINTAELGEMVEHINKTEVLNGEVLSDHVYFYSRETDQVSMVFGNR